jgi:hypothetical protein
MDIDIAQQRSHVALIRQPLLLGRQRQPSHLARIRIVRVGLQVGGASLHIVSTVPAFHRAQRTKHAPE